ncbi:MAG: patatin-like phospholipase family protein [Burkholderiales bacterium]|nr:patatin-like phospholipase family protein [Burkholderiales bacterium]
MATRPPANPCTAPCSEWDTVALVLQGGGALGSYQAGVVEGLLEAGIEPDWIAGISIGALNTAIIAGNAPDRRLAQLQGFWETICSPPRGMGLPHLPAPLERAFGTPLSKLRSTMEASLTLALGQNGFFNPRGLAPWLGLDEPVTNVSFYDTDSLKATLERFVDFDRINAGETRVSVGAVDVQSGNFTYFDNTQGPAKGCMRPEHFMASGALPPGFPAIEVQGRYYWDGGLVSNTPLAEVLHASPRRNTLTFQVDLWSAKGPLPTNVFDAQERQKDIQYSSRTRAITDVMQHQQRNRHLLRQLLELIPEKERNSHPCALRAAQEACSAQYAVLHLIYQDKEWEGHAKDYEFSFQTMQTHWQTGLRDIRHTLSHPEWLTLPPPGTEFVTYDQHRSTACHA